MSIEDYKTAYPGDWGLGIGDWGLGVGDWGLGARANGQSASPDTRFHTPRSSTTLHPI